MKIGKTRFWIDNDEHSIGIRSSDFEHQPIELYLYKHWDLPSIKVYETNDECDRAEYRLSFKFFWFTLNMLLWLNKNKTIRGWDDGREWGIGFYDRECFRANWGNKKFWWDLPFVTHIHIKREILNLNKNHVVHDTKDDFKSNDNWEKRNEIIKRHSISLPYRYECLNGEVQDVNASVSIERSTTRRKWLPFKSYVDYIDVKFDSEVGEKAGSWKGGCIGCSYKMNKNENAVQCLRRMERERLFR